jgi:DNA repair protein RadA
VFDLAIPYQLTDVGGGALTGTDERIVLELVTKAKKTLVDSGLLYKDFSTAQDILDRRKNLLRCTTGSAKLDSFLRGGIETQAITETAGEFDSGKSQICYTLCVTANTPLDRKGLGGNVIFIDNENTFRSERIFQIAEHRGISEPDEILRRIYVCKIYNTSHLEMIIQDLGKSIEDYRIMLRKAGKTRIATMVDSPYHMYDQTRFSITEAGVQDVEEYKTSGSEW